MSHNQRFLILFLLFFWMVHVRGCWNCLSPSLTLTLSTSFCDIQITTHNTYVKDWMMSTHERTLTERHTEYNTNTACRCTQLQFDFFFCFLFSLLKLLCLNWLWLTLVACWVNQSRLFFVQPPCKPPQRDWRSQRQETSRLGRPGKVSISLFLSTLSALCCISSVRSENGKVYGLGYG